MIKHRADSGGVVKGPCSSENGQKVREWGSGELKKKEAIEGR